MFLDEADGLKPIFSLGYNIYVTDAFQQVGKFIARELLIVHDYCGKVHSVSCV
jgi:hypothetical protein